MLSFFRRLVASRIGKVIVFIILGVIALAFLLSDVSGGMSGPSGAGGANQTIATVGGRKIGAAELTRAIDQQLAAARQETPGLDMATFVQGGGADRALESLIAARALDVFADEQGMAVSKRLVDGEIASIPAFNGPAGKFDQQTFQALLAQQRITERDLRTDIEGEVLRRMLLGPVAAGTLPPVGVTSHYAALLMEDRRGTIGFVPAAAMPAPKPATDAEIRAYYQRNLARFTLGERRVIRYALFGPDTLTVAPPSDAEIQRYYAANAATYGGRSTRTLSQVVFPDRAEAAALAERVRGGTAFAAAAQAAGFAPGDTALGPQSREQFAALANPAAAAAVFALPQGGIAGPLQSELGWHVVRVDAINTTAARPLAAVRGEIVEKLSVEKRDAALADQVNAIDEAIVGGASFEDVARQYKLSVVTTPPVLADGRAPGVAGWAPAPELLPLLRDAFQASPDEDPVVERIGETPRHALFGVVRIDPARPLPLAQVRAQVAATLEAEARSRAAKAVADAIAAKANGGVALATAFAQSGTRLPAPEAAGGRRIDLTRDGSKTPPALAAMFSIAPGRTRVVAAPAGQGWFVVKLERITKGDPKALAGLTQATQRELAPVLSREYAEQFARATQAALGVTRDEEAFRALKARIAGAASPGQ